MLREIGIEHHGESKSVEQFRNQDFDLVITVCDDANEECPVWLGRGKRVHEGFRDPAKAEGTDEERLTVFRQVRDEMLKKIPTLLKIKDASDTKSLAFWIILTLHDPQSLCNWIIRKYLS